MSQRMAVCYHLYVAYVFLVNFKLQRLVMCEIMSLPCIMQIQRQDGEFYTQVST